eukprot:gene15246-18048_t
MDTTATNNNKQLKHAIKIKESSQTGNHHHVENHLKGDVVRFVDIGNHHWSCIDGRTPHHVLATPGGDAGEFLLGLSVYKSLLSAPYSIELDSAIIRQMFAKFLSYLPANRPFYMHTDTYAHDGLRAHLQAIHGKEVFPDEFHILDTPTTAQHDHVLEAITLPEFVGCGHIRAIMANPDIYHVPLPLIQSFIRGFYDLVWSKSDRVYLDILEGQHEEIGLLEVQMDALQWNEKVRDGKSVGMIPSIKPSSNTDSHRPSQMFTVHSRTIVEQGIRKDIAHFLSSLTSLKVSHIMEILSKKSEVFTKATLNIISPQGVDYYSAEVLFHAHDHEELEAA